MKVSRGFESHPLRTRVSEAEKIAVCVAKCPRARRFLRPKSRREMSIDDDLGPFGKILSVSIFWRGLWKFHHKTKVLRESAEFSKQKHFALSIGNSPVSKSRYAWVKGDRDTRIRLAPFEPARRLSEAHDHLNAEDLSFFPSQAAR